MKKNFTKRALLSSVLALIVCFAMLVGTTFAWFTDSVSSENNIIKTGKLDVTMEWANGSEDPANANWKDASRGPIFEYELWEPGYAAARHIKVSNIGTLALNYQMRIVANGLVSELADVIDVYYFDEDVAMERSDLANATLLGTLREVLGTEKSIANTVKGSIVAGGASDIHTIVFKMQEDAGNEYQNMDLGKFSVELFATQMASETDSFDNQYDAGASALQAARPAANVTPLGKTLIRYTKGINGSVFEDYLDAAYQFQPTMTWEEAQASDYRYWHADFVVYADHDVPAESIMLAGYYDAWCQYNDDNWVGLTADVVIPAGEQVRLVEGLNGATVNWEELCRYGNDGIGFLCGLADMSDDGVNAGTTITVELRIYETGAQGECDNGGGCKHPTTACETGVYYTVGTFTYTFE